MTNIAETQTKKKRYVVTISIFQYSDNDNQAIVEAVQLAEKLNKESDCRASVDCISESEYGKIGWRKVM